MSNQQHHIYMLTQVAQALGNELANQVAFVGGSTTGLFITDDFVRQQVRFTEDVDLIVSVIGYGGWQALLEKLKKRGFKQSAEDEVICRLRLASELGEIKVDVMPDDDTLGFTNPWYKVALETAKPYTLNDDCSIRLIAPEYFVATKISAFLGRGNGDVLRSHDIEDLLNIINGRVSLVDEIKNAPEDVQVYIAEHFANLLAEPDMEYAILSATESAERAKVLMERIEAIIKTKKY